MHFPYRAVSVAPGSTVLGVYPSSQERLTFGVLCFPSLGTLSVWQSSVQIFAILINKQVSQAALFSLFTAPDLQSLDLQGWDTANQCAAISQLFYKTEYAEIALADQWGGGGLLNF